MSRTILLISVALFLAWRSLELLHTIRTIPAMPWGLAIFLAVLLNLFVTGVFAFSGFALPTQRLLPAAYYRIGQPVHLRHWYSLLGVDAFRRLLLATFWKRPERQRTYFSGQRSGMKQLVLQSKKAEFGHLLPLILISLTAGYATWRGLYVLAAAAMAINIPLNFYPVVLQRYLRMRVQRLLGGR